MTEITAGPKLMYPIERLKPHPQNAREHSEEQISQLAKSMEEFTFTQPILADENDVILAGHGKLLGARRLGLTEVPVIVLSGLTEIQKRAYLIADNQLGLNSSWDEEKLRLLVEQLERELASLDITGLSPQETDRILADLAPEPNFVDEDAVPETPVSPVTVPGDVWILGKHRLGCGDATSREAYEGVLQGTPADMVFTDFPYNVNLRQKSRTGIHKVTNDDLGADFGEFLHSICVQLLAVTRGAVYICMSSSELHTLHRAFTEAGGHWSTFLIWAKDRFTLGRSNYQRMYEPILFGWKEGEKHFWCGARNEGDVWFIPKPRVNRLHPTMKPVSLIERAIRNSSRRGDLILDSCGGSGSTLIACEKTKRRAAVIEIEPKYVDVMIRRWEAYTHQQAHLEADGRTFEEVAQERMRLNLAA
jgi:DNA modification methylase